MDVDNIAGIDRYEAGGVKLTPVDDFNKELTKRVDEMIRIYRIRARAELDFMDVTLKSEFNEFDFYKWHTFSRRCNDAGAPDPQGTRYRGVAIALYSSVLSIIDWMTLEPTGAGDEIEVSFGRKDGGDGPAGIPCNVQDKYNKFRGEKTLVKAYQKAGFTVSTEKVSETEILINATAKANGIDAALRASDQLCYEYYYRIGLESRAYNLMKVHPNFCEVTDDNLADLIRMKGEERASYEDIVMLTATKICRRCTREWPDIQRLVILNPDVRVGIAFIDKPKFKFMPKVFDEDCGEVRYGDKVTPFVIYYSKGKFIEYYATRKDEPPPDFNVALDKLEKNIRARR